jgi:hypothetical protein
MSIVTLKKKTMIKMSGNRNESFSINGATRNVGRVGTESKFSRNGTPFKGVHPVGNGGCCGTYTQNIHNPNRSLVGQSQRLYTKPSVLSTRGMLRSRYACIYTGVFPQSTVQPLNVDTSQGLYLRNKMAQNICVDDINKPDKYETTFANTSPTLCQTTTAGFTFDSMVRNAPYTKQLKQSMSSSERTTRIQKKCALPTGPQKPFPFAAQTGRGILNGGQNKNAGVCKSLPVYMTPPDWYMK